MNKKVLIGEIIGVFGIKGELKVRSESDFIDYRFRKNAKITTSNNKEYTITSMRVHKNNVLITVNELYDINMVQDLVGMKIYADDNDRPPLEASEYYLDDLIGLEVYNTEGEYLGNNNDMIEIPSGYLMEIIDKQKNRFLVPFVDEFVKSIDDKQIIIKEIEGLR